SGDRTLAAKTDIARLQPRQHAAFTSAHVRIETLGARDSIARGPGAHRLITDDLLALKDRRDMRIHVVVVAVLAAVFDDAHPVLALAKARPQRGEGRGRHIRVAHQIVGMANQLSVTETADLDEAVI